VTGPRTWAGPGPEPPRDVLPLCPWCYLSRGVEVDQVLDRDDEPYCPVCEDPLS